MNRTERLYAIAEQLRRTGANGATAARLASLLEVSTRTVKRDITALQESGMPIWAQTGPSGGYFLDDAATLPPVNFTASQAVAVSIALAVLPAGSPFNTDGEAAARKVRDALDPQASQRATSLASRVWVQPMTSDTPKVNGGVLRAIEQSLVGQRTLSMTYISAQGVSTRRTIEPTIIAWADHHWYVVAYCQERGDTRWFRLDRIVRADVTKTRYTARPVADIGKPPPSARPVDDTRSKIAT